MAYTASDYRKTGLELATILYESDPVEASKLFSFNNSLRRGDIISLYTEKFTLAFQRGNFETALHSLEKVIKKHKSLGTRPDLRLCNKAQDLYERINNFKTDYIDNHLPSVNTVNSQIDFDVYLLKRLKAEADNGYSAAIDHAITALENKKI